jgi:hypothetical protein
MFLVLMDATVLPYQLTFKSTFDPDDFDVGWLWITTLVFGIDVVSWLWIQWDQHPKGSHFRPPMPVASIL